MELFSVVMLLIFVSLSALAAGLIIREIRAIKRETEELRKNRERLEEATRKGDSHAKDS